VASYAEAAGILLALRVGISPASLTRPLATLRPTPRTAQAGEPVLAGAPVALHLD
jgi:hypothetical protein